MFKYSKLIAPDILINLNVMLTGVAEGGTCRTKLVKLICILLFCWIGNTPLKYCVIICEVVFEFTVNCKDCELGLKNWIDVPNCVKFKPV